MAIRLAIVGLEPIQQDWIAALRTLAAAGDIDLVAAAHRHVGLSREITDALAAPPLPPSPPPPPPPSPPTTNCAP